MKRIILAAALAFSLTACTQVQNVWDTVTSASVTPTTVIVAANTFDALEATATNYLRLPKCTGSNGPVCRDKAATAQIIPAVRAGRVARTNLEQFFKDHPGQLGPKGLYDALTAAISTLQSVFAQYQITGAAR